MDFGIDHSFVARTAERGQIVRQLQRAEAGSAHLVVIEALAGMGKSALLRRALADCGRPALSIVLDESDREEPGSAGVPALWNPETAQRGEAHELLEAAAARLEELGAGAVVVIENFHWVDDLSAQVLWRLLREPQHRLGALVVTTRPCARPDLSGFARHAQTGSCGAFIDLPPLNADQSRELLAELAGVPVGAEAAGAVHAATDGIPAHVVSIGAWLSQCPPGAGRSIENAVAHHQAALARAGHPFHQAISSMVRGLDPHARSLLTLLATAGQPLSAQQMAEVVEHPVELTVLTEAGVSEWDAASFGYRIRYRSVAVVLQALIPPEERAQWHQRVAALLGSSAGVTHRATALRLEPDESGRRRLVAEALAVARDLLTAGRPGESAEHLVSVLPLDTGSEVVVLLLRSVAHGADVRALLEAEPAIRALPPGALRSGGLALLRMRSGEPWAAMGELAQVVDLAAEENDAIQLFARAVAQAGVVSVTGSVPSRWSAVLARTTEALDVYLDGAEGTAGEVRGLRGLIATWRVLATPRPLVDPIEAIGDIADQLAQTPSAESAYLGIRAVRGARLHQVGACQSAYYELEASSQGLPGQDRLGAFGRSRFALSLFDAGLWDEAAAVAAQAAEGGLERGECDQALISYAVDALVRAARGQESAHRILDRLWEAPGSEGSPASRVYIDYARAWAAITAEDHARAIDALLRTNESDLGLACLGIMPLTLLARELASIGRPEVIASIITTLQDDSVPALEAPRRYAIAHARGLSRSDPQERLDLLFDALDWLDHKSPPRTTLSIAEGGGFRMQRALLALDIAGLVSNQRFAEHRTTGIGLAVWAATVFQRCGARVLEQRAGDLATSLREDAPTLASMVGPRSASAPATDPALRHKLSQLSGRERQVTLLIGEGKSNPEIAEDLYISVRTVEKHIAKIFKKLEVSSRREAKRLLRGAVAEPR
ncbi:helix-turn-helix transcriptional regulator [Bogoriella caseilytica]|nr:LuxR family transcriptional regulator [Bogoriella caseilytica]